MAQNELAEAHAALARAITRCEAVPKRGLNNHHRYHYATAEDLIAEARGALATEGLALVPTSCSIEAIGETPALKRAWVLTHKGGGSIPLESPAWPIVPERGRPIDKAVAIADTASLRWLLRDLLLIPAVDATEDMDQRNDQRGETTGVRGVASPERAGSGQDPRAPSTPGRGASGTSTGSDPAPKPPPQIPLYDRADPAKKEDKHAVVGWGKRALVEAKGLAPEAASARIGELAAALGAGASSPLTRGQLDALVEAIEKEAFAS